MAQQHHDPAAGFPGGSTVDDVRVPAGRQGPVPSGIAPVDAARTRSGAPADGARGGTAAPPDAARSTAGARPGTVGGPRPGGGKGAAGGGPGAVAATVDMNDVRGAGGRGMGGDVLTGHLQDQATEFLRSLRTHRESGGTGSGGEESAEAARALRGAARRIGGTLHIFRPLLDTEWSDTLRTELAWLSSTLGHEHACAARLERLLGALHRLSGAPPLPTQAVGTRGTGTPRPAAEPVSPGALTVGAAKAGALLERQLTLARTRAHSTALQALGSSRFHAVADRVAVLASEVPLSPGASGAALEPLAVEAEARLAEAVSALPLYRAGRPYNADALTQGLAADPAPHTQDAPWHQVRLLLRLHRYAREVLRGQECADRRLTDAGRALDRHRDAAEAAAAAAAAARTPRIAPSTAYALGVLHADQRHEVEAARFGFQEIWLREAVTTR